MTPSGIEPVTFRFVAQHLNYCATAVPFLKLVQTLNKLLHGGCVLYHLVEACLTFLLIQDGTFSW